MMAAAALWRLLPPLAALLAGVCGWGQNERVLLKDVGTITLYADRYTTARRAAAVPQLKCMGGGAGCGAALLQAVQCYNRGWDGVDVQWECKAEMDSAYRFGRIEVSCEGFDYPDDPYVLRGSCGLEYTLEVSEDGRRSQSGHREKASDWSTKRSSYSTEVLQFLLLLGLAYGVYKLFLSGSPAPQQPNPDNYGHENQTYSQANAPPPPGFTERQTYSQASAPPPPGFKGHFTGSSSGFDHFGAASSGSQTGYRPGFWTGLGSGLGLGYLFGSQRPRTNYFSNYSSYTPHDSMWSRPSFHGPARSTSSFGTTSGFGGTKRR